MIPAAFAYARPTTIDEALQAVASGGEDVKILAGGQSLIPVMRLRLAAPETVVDLTKVAELRGVQLRGEAPGCRSESDGRAEEGLGFHGMDPCSVYRRGWSFGGLA